MPEDPRPQHRLTPQGRKVVIAADRPTGDTAKPGFPIGFLRPSAPMETRLEAIEEEVDEILAMLHSKPWR